MGDDPGLSIGSALMETLNWQFIELAGAIVSYFNRLTSSTISAIDDLDPLEIFNHDLVGAFTIIQFVTYILFIISRQIRLSTLLDVVTESSAPMGAIQSISGPDPDVPIAKERRGMLESIRMVYGPFGRRGVSWSPVSIDDAERMFRCLQKPIGRKGVFLQPLKDKAVEKRLTDFGIGFMGATKLLDTYVGRSKQKPESKGIYINCDDDDAEIQVARLNALIQKKKQAAAERNKIPLEYDSDDDSDDEPTTTSTVNNGHNQSHRAKQINSSHPTHKKTVMMATAEGSGPTRLEIKELEKQKRESEKKENAKKARSDAREAEKKRKDGLSRGELDKEKATKANKLQLAREEKEAQERREKRQRDIASGLIPTRPDVPARTGNICKVLGQIKKSVPNAGLFNSYCHHRGAKQPIDPNDSMWGGFADSYSRAYKDYKKYLLSNPRGDMTADDHRTMYFNTIFLPSDQQTATADQDPTVHHPDTENPPVASPPPSESFGGNDDQLFGDNSCHLEPTPPLEYGAMCDSSFDTPPMDEGFDTSVTDLMEIESPSSQQTEEKNKRSNKKDGGDKRKDHPVAPEQDGDDEEIVEQPKKKTKPNTQISKVAITTKKKPSSEKKSVVKESSSDSGEEEEDHPKKKKKSLAKKPVVEDSSDSEDEESDQSDSDDEESDQSDSDDDTTKGAPHKAVNRTPIKQRKGKSGVGTPKNKSQKKNASALTRLTSFYKNSKEARPLLKRLLEQGSRGFVVDKVHRPADPKATYYCDFSIHLPGLKETSERIPGIATKLGAQYPDQDIVLTDGKIVRWENGKTYPFYGSECKFEPKTSTGFPGGGLVLGANEKIFNSDGSVYNSGGGGGTTPLDTKGVTFQTDGIHLTTNQNVYNSDGTPINNSPPPLNTQGVTFNTDGVHLAPGQNVYKSDGTPINNGSSQPPLDTKGLVFTTQGPVLASNQKIYNQDGSVYQDTKGVVFGQDGIHLLAGQNVYDSDGVPLDNAPLPLDTEGVVFTTQGPKLAAGQNYLLSDGTPLQPVVNNVTNVNLDTKGVTFQTDGVHMAAGQNSANGTSPLQTNSKLLTSQDNMSLDVYGKGIRFMNSSIPSYIPTILDSYEVYSSDITMTHASVANPLVGSKLRCMRIGNYVKVGFDKFWFTGPYSGGSQLIGTTGVLSLPTRFQPPYNLAAIGASSVGYQITDGYRSSDTTRCSLINFNNGFAIRITHKDGVYISVNLASGERNEFSSVFWEWFL
ncbi:hypothetical protein DFA_03730 [Cavenderia fasciculata]|uniref:Uncharacterized protein n=1 Tax=Cavenderia fasciculata TaxID=261658 RepID=F4Q092_CACFS|nr:uncharacterized protein DFA_03730 [Cavenderia fasciculata]EGG18243.1 hypothetical protein DFA_03730 [Cavenderia fasciculata]|eukprot:XP_004357066.1 hypothetical protein DFA_03730 [Cavenderia fasciculata]